MKRAQMELDDDTHLCLRCGKTIIGLDCYVLHRQQQCYKPTGSSVLSESSSKVPSSESPVEELNSDLPQSICKPSADDFFLSLNLQSNLKHDNSLSNISCGTQKSASTENFCSRLDITTFDNDFETTFSENKEMCSSNIVDETDSLTMDEMVLSNEKWDSNFKIHGSFCTASQGTKGAISNFLAGENIMLQMDPVYEANSLCSDTFTYKEAVHEESHSVDSNLLYSKAENIKEHVKSLSLPELRFSFRQKLNTSCSLMCCDDVEKYLCNLCDHVFGFQDIFLDHLLSCRKTDSSIWISEIFKNEILFIHSLRFKCLLCSFYCNDSVVFLNHLESSDHRQNTASLTKPLICFPCQDECCASDEMFQHFSKNHYLSDYKKHPVIITEAKKSLHCCYCLSFVRTANHFQSKEMFHLLSFNDILFYKDTLPYVSPCCYRIDSFLPNSHIQSLNTFTSLISNSETQHSDMISNGLTNLYCTQDRLKKNSEVPKNDCCQIVKQLNQNHATYKDKSILVMQNGAKICGDTVIKKPFRKYKKSLNKKLCHLSAKKYSCTICKAQYSSKSALKHHLKAHTLKNDKVNCISNASQNNQQKKIYVPNVYLCSKCGYRTKTAQMLTRHERTHTGERPFKCKDCSYSCCLSSQLLRHKRLHSGSKPYKCPYCKYVCNSQENLRKHILKTKKHKGKKMYKCQFCDYGCNVFSDYREHLLNSHLEHFPNGEKDINSSAVAGIYKSVV
ncbi:zinc finger protein 761-like isoform X2 [Stegodyphus dumicola]|uniref:zinc finger protein 761-like isoform X2 n=1 Tax=Stegodyphus dumicola TaxID=202533 RepID=UPI0015B2D94C|nr:zinc finger protein 761-like isoform X2 [Stegodyphus dumicola]